MSTWFLTKGVFSVQRFTTSDKTLVLTWDFELPSQIFKHILGESIPRSEEVLSLFPGAVVVLPCRELLGFTEVGGRLGWCRGDPRPCNCFSFISTSHTCLSQPCAGELGQGWLKVAPLSCVCHCPAHSENTLRRQEL